MCVQGWELLGQRQAVLANKDNDDEWQCNGQRVQYEPVSNPAKLPQGAKLLKAADSNFLIAPLGHLRDETYSIYFRFKH